ncbi:hypothetical protein EDD17DRAFT_1482744 [Pisolithus thermaeus]|nr:hypothetical protein EV401DRAFT_1861655 [Pisolithus croceorrhizus]KAI6160900.1 hypothetical protein EDD17DRAFT_1482744 [Pisolithus thermaeus]
MAENAEPGSLTRVRKFKDWVHDYVSFSPWICSFIDTKHFQRLRSVKQLGVSYFVFPGAAHNRFEHCLGVGHLARLMAMHLKTSQPQLGITDQHVKCVELAGLCHDLGHGPWSHLWDGVFIPTALPGKRWKHEDASEMMFDDLVETYRPEITPEEVIVVKALIAGDRTRCPLGAEKPFLFEIVANARNGLDVDKFDYIARDCHAVGDRGNLLISSARVIDNKICYDIKDANQIYELYYTRFSLHKRVYNHKTTKAIEYMVTDALLAAEPYLKLASLVDKPDRYVFLTDNLLNKIQESTEKELEPARAIIERIHTRDLYRLVDYKVFLHADLDMVRQNVTPARIVEVAKSGSLEGVDEELVVQLTEEYVAVNVSVLHYGKGPRNPLDDVTFYSKQQPDVGRKADHSDISLLMPSVFAEVWLRVYTKDCQFFGLIQAAYRQILKMLQPSEGAATSDEQQPADEVAPEELDDPEVMVNEQLHRPSTPLASNTIGANRRGRTFGRTPSFSDNAFTTVPPNFRDVSPSRKPRSKRAREGEESGSMPAKKSRIDGVETS